MPLIATSKKLGGSRPPAPKLGGQLPPAPPPPPAPASLPEVIKCQFLHFKRSLRNMPLNFGTVIARRKLKKQPIAPNYILNLQGIRFEVASMMKSPEVMKLKMTVLDKK